MWIIAYRLCDEPMLVGSFNDGSNIQKQALMSEREHS